MKKAIFILTALIIAATTIHAQDSKLFVSGTASYSSSKTDQDGAKPYTNSTFGPSVGYFLKENIVIGLGISIGGTKHTEESSDFIDTDGDGFPDSLVVTNVDVKSGSFDITPWIRYVKPVSDNLSLFGQFQIDIGSTKDKNGSTTTAKTSSFDIGVGPGLDYKFAPAWSISGYWGFLNYSSVTNKAINSGDKDVKNNTFNIGLDLTSIDFALNYHF